MHGINLYLLRPTIRAWMKQVDYLPQALLDYVPVELLSLLPETGIVDKLLYCNFCSATTGFCLPPPPLFRRQTSPFSLPRLSPWHFGFSVGLPPQVVLQRSRWARVLARRRLKFQSAFNVTKSLRGRSEGDCGCKDMGCVMKEMVVVLISASLEGGCTRG